MDSESDTEEFYDAPEEVSSSPARKAARERGNRQSTTNQYEDELRHLEEEKRKAEEKREKEDAIMQHKIRELEEKKREEQEREEQRLREEMERLQKEREAEVKRRLEEEERQREEQEAEDRRQEAIRRRKRLEQMRRNEDGEEIAGTIPGNQGQPDLGMPSDAEPTAEESNQATDQSQDQDLSQRLEREPGLANRNVEPDVIASTKERPSELPLSGAAPSSPSADEPSPSSAAPAQDDMPPPVAPPRRKKKQKKIAEIPRQESFESQTSSALSISFREPSEEGSLAGGDEQPIGLPPESQSRPLSGLLTPTTTIESITRELEHSLDLASAVHGGDYIVFHKDTQSIKGESRQDLKVQRAMPKGVKQGGAPVSTTSQPPEKPSRGASQPPEKPSRGNTPETEKLLKYYNLMQGQSMTGEELTDEEILSQVIVKNLDNGETVPLLLAEERLPQCVNPLSLHIMRITSEYVSNSSLDKEAGSDGEKETGATEVAHQIKEKKKKLKKFLGKTVHKLKTAADEAFRHDDQEISEEESIPDTRYCKFKAASSHKGSYDFDQLVNCQDLSGEHTGAIWTMRFSHCGRLLATGGQDHLLRVWVLKDYYKYFDDMRQRYNNESRAKSATQGSSDSSSSSLERDRKPEEIEEEREQLKKEVMEMEGSIEKEKEEEARRAAEEDVDGAQEENGEAVFAKAPFFTYSGHTADLLDISWSKNYFILSSSMDKMVRLWHVSRSECLCCFQHIDFVTAIAFHPRDDRYFLSGSLDGKLRLWNIPDKKVALWNEVDGPTKLITAANFIQNGRFSVVGTYDGRCIFYDTEHLKYYTQIHVRSTRGRNAKGRKITAIEPLPGQDKILVTSNDSRIRLYDLRDLSLSCKYKGCANVSSQIKASFSHNHRYIICGSEDHAFYIWKTHYDFAKFTSVRRDRNDFWESIRVHDAVTTSVVFSPNPKLVLGPAPSAIQTASGLDPQQLVKGSSSPSPTSKKDRSDSVKGEPGAKEGKHSSLKRPPDLGEVLVSADFNGAIKVFIKHPK
ncbi:WD repeat-containing protein 44 [Strongylocentrotus purpuratus]|uniref:WD repeat-containing protein 44 n=1 Tax=Strongylocentrotus purpuratus TaxID=7668 RepID=A0A7M7NM59_STRPU|nr:WD repeat-containing protein 44 [Strongylocentrotus purpuratus]